MDNVFYAGQKNFIHQLNQLANSATVQQSYYGASAAVPATRPDGTPCRVGDRYFDIETSAEKTWNGSAWLVPNLSATQLASPNGTDHVAYAPLAGSAVTVTQRLRQFDTIYNRTAQNRKIVILGSSVALGQGSPSWNGWSNRLATALAPRGYTVVNKSIGGNKTSDCIGRFYTDVVTQNPGIVIICLSIANEGLIGGNKDVVYNTYISGIRRLVSMCREMNYKVVVTGVYPNNDFTETDYMYALQANQELENSDFPYVNFMGTVDDGTGKWRTGTFADVGHPNDVGHDLMFKSFALSLFGSLTSGLSYRPEGKKVYALRMSATAIGTSPVIYVADSPLGSFTVMATIRRFDGVTAGRPLICLENSTANWESVRIRNSVDNIELAAANTLINTTVPTAGAAPNTVMLSYDGFTNKWTLYVNGNLEGTAVYAPTQTLGYDRVVFGGRSDIGGFETIGYEFSDLAVWRAALNPVQVAEAFRGVISKASLCLYSPALDSTSLKGSRLVNLAMSDTYAHVTTDGVVAVPADIFTETPRVSTPIRTQANGLLNTAMLDPNVPLLSSVPLGVGVSNKYGYNFLQGGQVQRLYKIATLERNSISSTYSSLRIDALMGGWGGSDITAMTIIIGSRSTSPVEVDWTTSRFIPTNVRFVVYQEVSGEVSVYVFFLGGAFAQVSFQLMGMGAITYARPIETTAPTGTVVWDPTASFGNAAYLPARSYGMGADTSQPKLGTSFNGYLGVRAISAENIATSFLKGGAANTGAVAGSTFETLRLGVSGQSGVNNGGCWSWLTSAGTSGILKTGYKLTLRNYDVQSNAFSADLFSVSGNGQVYVPTLKAGTVSTAGYHEIVQAGVEGADILQITSSAAFRKCDNNWGNLANAAMIVQANSVTNRSSNNRGTVNTMGNDYAEYIFKSSVCGIVAPGQLVGITAENKVTDQWNDAVMFSIKSTAPSFVGGDSWADDVGPRPSAQAGTAPTEPLRREDVVTQQPVPGTNPAEYEDVVTEPGDTDDEWAEKQAAHTAALAAHNIAVQQDAEAMAAFDAALEVERQKVDRIAIAGRVPVNVLGAQPGDYIVPVQDGAGIMGIPVCKADLTHSQYLDAVGRVISIEPDGRAYVMVKVV
ncbi:GDSL-type esterase/lipase family protein [Janthinobacterium lividum]|uniref:GDSL-type esterase/lipase family protein n=1 Tax=Janthinobacterium lividum TaxID=29581 RepID=UPI001B820988|nr:GDSL-type esterase/lipase family protein [Janthinobacterium lividum]MBR7635134.1 hypothetical protein [Janthinobacterium lividum]